MGAGAREWGVHAHTSSGSCSQRLSVTSLITWPPGSTAALRSRVASSSMPTLPMGA